jgi:hypothetical protein
MPHLRRRGYRVKREKDEKEKCATLRIICCLYYVFSQGRDLVPWLVGSPASGDCVKPFI